MADFPYTANTPGLGRLFSQIQSVGKPDAAISLI
jgi:hypothetical protein